MTEREKEIEASSNNQPSLISNSDSFFEVEASPQMKDLDAASNHGKNAIAPSKILNNVSPGEARDRADLDDRIEDGPLSQDEVDAMWDYVFQEENCNDTINKGNWIAKIPDAKRFPDTHFHIGQENNGGKKPSNFHIKGNLFREHLENAFVGPPVLNNNKIDELAIHEQNLKLPLISLGNETKEPYALHSTRLLSSSSKANIDLRDKKKIDPLLKSKSKSTKHLLKNSSKPLKTPLSLSTSNLKLFKKNHI